MKTFTICKISKDLSEFSPRKNAKDGLCGRCKECHRKEVRELYRKNPEAKNQDCKRRKQILFNLTNEIKRKCGCNICKEKDPICLDFHHLTQEKKTRPFRGWCE